jgi:uncharacterized membrane protein (DUF2068 family)
MRAIVKRALPWRKTTAAVYGHAVVSSRRTSTLGLAIIGAFKLAKAALLVLVAIAAGDLMRHDTAEVVERWATQLHLDPDGRVMSSALDRIGELRPSSLRAIRVGAWIYAALLTVEGVGLLLRKRWGEYLTTIITASLVPLELYEIARHATATRIAALAVNVAIVVYLIARLRRGD